MEVVHIDGAVRSLLGNDILPNLSIKVLQLPAPSFRQTSHTCSVYPSSAAALYKNQFETDELIKRTPETLEFRKFIHANKLSLENLVMHNFRISVQS